ncbi:MAG: hypothetical protein ABL893_19850, partial [Hyphomicrobium sp.]
MSDHGISDFGECRGRFLSGSLFNHFALFSCVEPDPLDRHGRFNDPKGSLNLSRQGACIFQNMSDDRVCSVDTI